MPGTYFCYNHLQTSKISLSVKNKISTFSQIKLNLNQNQNSLPLYSARSDTVQIPLPQPSGQGTQSREFLTCHEAEDLSRMKSSPGRPGRGRVNSTEVFGPMKG